MACLRDSLGLHSKRHGLRAEAWCTVLDICSPFIGHHLGECGFDHAYRCSAIVRIVILDEPELVDRSLDLTAEPGATHEAIKVLK